MMKLIRTIQLDNSDAFVFEHAATPGEWAVTGAFLFAECDPTKLDGKARVAFRSGFLGIASFGWSTLVQVVDANEADRQEAIDALAQKLVVRFGAPGIAEAAAAATEEIEFAASLCSHPPDTLIALHRTWEGGEIREAFRTLRPKEGPRPLRAFAFLEVEGEEEPSEMVNLATLAKGQTREN